MPREQPHERAAEVRLQEHEEDGHQTEPDGCSRRARLLQALAAFGQEARECEHEEHLAELGRLEPEEAEVEPALRAPDRTREEDDRDQERHAPEDHAPAGAVELGVDEHHGHEAEHADRRVDGLAREVVVRVAGDVVTRDVRDRPEAVPDQQPDGSDQDPVEPADERRDVGTFAPARARGRPGGVVDHQSE